MTLHSTRGHALSSVVLTDLGNKLEVFGDGVLKHGYKRAGGIDHSNYYKWLRQQHSPRLTQIAALLDAMGYKLAIVPKEPGDA